MNKTKEVSPWVRMDSIMKDESEPSGSEWFTIRDVMVRYKLSYKGAEGRVTSMVSSGTLRKWSGTGTGSSGKRRVVNKYSFTQ